MGETLNPLLEDGTWLRCALHARSTSPDGELAPEHAIGHDDRAGSGVPAMVAGGSGRRAWTDPPWI